MSIFDSSYDRFFKLTIVYTFTLNLLLKSRDPHTVRPDRVVCGFLIGLSHDRFMNHYLVRLAMEAAAQKKAKRGAKGKRR